MLQENVGDQGKMETITSSRADDWKISMFGKLQYARGHGHKTNAFMGTNLLMSHTQNGRKQQDKGMQFQGYQIHFKSRPAIYS